MEKVIKEESSMLVIPVHAEELEDCEEILVRLEEAEDFQLVSSEMTEQGISLFIDYLGERYQAEIYPTDFELPELYRCQHLFSDLDMEAIDNAEEGLLVELAFGQNPLASYHLQLKMIHAMLPDTLAVLDDSSEKILSGRWVALAAQSAVPPAPRYIYTAQAVSGGDGCVWLHTHGLNRCGIPELEVLNSTTETYQGHYNVLETLANRLLGMEELLEPREPLYLARLSEDTALVITLIPWEEAVEQYPPDMLGGKGDREGHNGDICVVFTYSSEEGYKAGRYEPLSVYDEILKDNPVYMISNEETNRMKALAAERIGYLQSAFLDKANHILIKLGLTVDKEYQTEDNFREHIWFELLDISGNQLTAKLTQEPYYISGMHEGSIGRYGFDQVTDWIIFTPENRITPDDAYLLEKC